MSKLDFIYIIIVLYMSMFDIAYVIVATTHVNIGHEPYVNITYEKINIILLEFLVFNGKWTCYIPYETYLEIKFGIFLIMIITIKSLK